MRPTKVAMPLLAALLAACASAPSAPPPPTLAAPAAWSLHSADAEADGEFGPAGFWSGFGSPALQALQQQARAANPDLQIAAAHLRIARDSVAAARAQQGPTLGVVAGSADSAATSVALPDAQRMAPYTLGFEASYELDLWGRLDRISASAQADAAATADDMARARIGVMNAVARAYFDLGQAAEALPLVQSRLSLAESAQRLQAARLDSGRIAIGTLDEAQDHVADLQQQAAQWQQQQRLDAAQLALLLGRLPEGFAPQVAPLRREMHLPTVPAGLPSQLLQRRPDVHAALARIDAAMARTDAVQAERFPQIRLTAQLGVATDLLHRIASGATGLVGIGPELSLPIYDGGARAARLDSARNEADIAGADYRKTALEAFADVERALLLNQAANAAPARDAALADRQAQRLAAVEAQMAAGHRSGLDLIAQQEQAIALQLQALEHYRAQLDARLALFEALGGGWQPSAAADDAVADAPGNAS